MNLTALFLAILAPQSAAPDRSAAETASPSPPSVETPDIKTEWVAPVKPPMSAEELAARTLPWNSPGTSPASAPGNELPAALQGLRPRIAHDRMHYDRPGDGKLWVRGRSYKASFGQEGTTYVPSFGPDAPRNFPVSLSVAEVTLGGQAIDFTRSVDATRDGDVVLYDRGTFVERYDMALESMEQKFVFTSLPHAGELAIEIAIDSELQVTQGADGALVFENEFGRVGYTSALIVDAHGSRFPIPTQPGAGRIRLSAPRALLEQCAFPITLDPVISTMTFATSGSLNNTDAAFDMSTNRFLVVWEDAYSSTDHDVWGEYWSQFGSPLGGGEWIDFTTDNWANPHVANNNAANTYLVVAQRGSNDNRRITGRIRNAGGPGQGSQFVVDGGGTGERYNPDVGGDTVTAGTSYYCVVFEREYDQGTDDHDVHAQLVSGTGSRVGGTIYIDNTANTLDRHPRISLSNSMGPRAEQRWNVVWSRRYAVGDEDVRGAQLHWDGFITADSFSIDFSGFNDEWPTVSGLLDDRGDGQRPYLVVYQRDNYSSGVTFGSVLVGSTRIDNPNLSALEGVTNSTRLRPAVATDGQVFMVGAASRFGFTSLFDMYISSFALDGSSELACLESRALLADAQDLDTHYDLHIASTRSAAGARQRCMATWTTNPLFGSTDVMGGIYESAPLPPGSAYCSSIPNSTGDAGSISASGSPSIADQDLTLQVTGLPANTPGLFFFGTTAIQATFGDGYRCVGGQVRRMYSFVHSDAGGTATRAIDWASGYASSLAPGNVYWQLWYRDAAAGLTGFNLSNGLSTTLVP